MHLNTEKIPILLLIFEGFADHIEKKTTDFSVYIDWEVLYIIYICVKERSWSS